MLYPETFEAKSGFSTVKEIISGYCTGSAGKELAFKLRFSDNYDIVQQAVSLTSEMQSLLRGATPFPFDNSRDVSDAVNKIRVDGAFLSEEELLDLKIFLLSLGEVLGFMRQQDSEIIPVLSELSSDISPLKAEYKAIDLVIDDEGSVKERASPALAEIRRNITQLSARVSRRLASIMSKARSDGFVDADANISLRNGRSVIPVSVFNKRRVPGLVHDQSSSGKTLFIEPSEIVEMNNDLFGLHHEERREVVRILTKLSGRLRPSIEEIFVALSYMAEVDLIRAKALFANSIGAIKPLLVNSPVVKWRRARHPLLVLSFSKQEGREVVPLDITLDADCRILVVSGPNAGGKSVCLKTVGLLQYMLQCGLTIPVAEGSESGLFDSIFIDIGDEQSIENDLSTYSSHLMAMKFFLKEAGDGTLILVDELGSGTEPVIGGAIAEAILDALRIKGVYGVVTTHYTNLKHYASSAEGVMNGAMAFDNHRMQPLFRLETGKPGSSFAFEIARKTGLPDPVLQAASDRAGRENVAYDSYLRDIARDRRYWERKRDSIRKLEKRVEGLAARYEAEADDLEKQRRAIIEDAREKAGEIISGSNRVIERTIREIREAGAEREKTRKARKEIENFRKDLDKVTDQAHKLPGRRSSGPGGAGRTLQGRSRRGDAPLRTKEPFVLRKGVHVSIEGSNSTGVVESVRDGNAVVSFGNVKVTISVSKLVPGDKERYRKEAGAKARGRIVLDEEKTGRSVSPTLDLRGVKADEAEVKLQGYLDQAIMAGFREVALLHGKGHGILREVVRGYLERSGVAEWYGDAPESQGGAGVTVALLRSQ